MSLSYAVGLIVHASGVAAANGSIAVSTASGGTAPYTYAWTSSPGASTIATPTTLAAKPSLLRGQYTVTITDNVGAQLVYIYDVSYKRTLSLISVANDAAGADNLGYATAVDGEYMVTGAYGKTVNGLSFAGAAYVFKRSGTTATDSYALIANLQSPVPVASGRFGISVGISGDTVAIGASALEQKVHVFFRTADTNWTLQSAAGLVADDRTTGDAFGGSIGIDGDYIVVGAPNWSTKSAPIYTNCGAGYVFKRTGTTWAIESGGKLLAADPSSGDTFGAKVSISGTYAAMSAPAWSRKTPTAITGCGAAYVFSRSGTTWTQGNGNAPLLASDLSASDGMSCISINGDYIVAGSPYWAQKSAAISNAGAAYIFVRNTSTSLWSQQAQLTAGDAATNDRFGVVVTMRGNLVLASSIYATTGGITTAGHSYLFTRSGTQWTKSSVLAAAVPRAADYFGYSVALSNKYLACGALQWDGTATDQGAVFTGAVLDITPGAVTPTGNYGSTTGTTGAIGAATVAGGTAPLSYTWSSNGTYATDVSTTTTAGPLSNLTIGIYTLSVTDANGTATSYAYTVSTLSQIVIGPGLITHASARASATGAIAATTAATGGTGTGYTYAWTNSSGASTISTPTTLVAKASLLPGQYTLTARDSNGGTGSYVYDVSYVSSLLTLTVASDPVVSDNFGFSAAIDGQYMVVGALSKFISGVSGAGAAYTFLRTDSTASGTYTFLARLVSPAPATNNNFGYSVAISGDTVAITEVGSAMRVHVFFRTSDTTWTLQSGTGLIASDRTVTADIFGCSVGIDGDYIAVGAASWSTKTGTIYSSCGVAYIFVRTGTAWAQQSQLLASDPSTNDQFGTAVAISGNYVAVGAKNWSQKTPLSIINCGAVYVFSRSGTTWSAGNGGVPLLAADRAANDQSGSSVSISGDYIVSGAPSWSQKFPSVSILYCGAAYIFVRDTTTSLWSQQAQLTVGDGIVSGNAGSAVSIRGTTALIGAYGMSSQAGRSYTFYRSGTTWLKGTVIVAGDATASDRLGYSACLSSRYVVCGAYSWSQKTPSFLNSSGTVYTTTLLAFTPGAVTLSGGNFGDTVTANGTIGAATVSNGLAPYTYSWTSTGTGVSAVTTAGPLSGLRPGTYTLNAADNNGVTSSYTYTISTYTQIVQSIALITHATGRTSATGAIAAVTASTGGTGTGYTYAWSNSSGASTISTPTTLVAKASLLPGLYTLTATDSNGGTGIYVYEISYTISLLSKALASDPAQNDTFGGASAIDGQYMVVGASAKNNSQGAAYTFVRSDTTAGGTYTFLAKLLSPVPVNSNVFGTAVAINGDTVVVGEPSESGGGKVHVFFRTNNTTWTAQSGTGLVASDRSTNDLFGCSVGIDGDYVVSGANGWSTKSAPIYTSCGAAYVFLRTGSTWAQQSRLLASDASAGDRLGWRVAISGIYIVCTAVAWSQKTPVALLNCGAAYVFSRSGTTWTVGNGGSALTASDASASDTLGYGVSISGDYFVVGSIAWSQKLPVISGLGCAYIFKRDTTTSVWSQQSQLTGGDSAVANTQSGLSVSIRGANAVISAYNATSNGVAVAGKAYLYNRSGAAWYKSGVLVAADPVQSDKFSYSVVLSDRYVVCGAANKTAAGVSNCGVEYTGMIFGIVPGAVTVSGGNFGDAITANGTIAAAAVAGGVAPYTYSWTSTGTDVSANTTPGPLSGLRPGSYTLTAVDSNALSTSYVYTISTYARVVQGIALITHATGRTSATGAIAAVTAPTGGTGVYTYTWSNSSGASTISTPTTLVAKTSLLPGFYTLVATDSNGASVSSVYEISYTIGLLSKALASDPAVNDAFGATSAIDGQYMVVGTSQKSSSTGAAYTFVRSDTTASGTYAFLAKLVSPAGAASNLFGFKVSISGDTAAVSEPGEAGGGKVHLFFRTNNTTWTAQSGTGLVAADRTANDQFGCSVSVDGDYVVAGAFNWSTKSAPLYTNCGAAYVFLRTGSTWTQQSRLLAADPSTGDHFGNAVAINGANTACTAPAWSQKTPVQLVNCGAVYVFSRSGTVWTAANSGSALTSNDPSANDTLGDEISVSGDYFAVGCSNWSQKLPAISGVGCAYVFKRDTTTSLWSQQAQLTGGDSAVANTQTGLSVCLRGVTAVVSAHQATSSGVAVAGKTYVFSRSGGSWYRTGVLYATDASTSDHFSDSVALSGSGSYVVCGAAHKTAGATNCGVEYTGMIFGIVPGAVTVSGGNFGDAFTANGTIAAAAVAGGVAPYTYSWTNTGTDVSTNTTPGPLANLRPGSYTLTAVDSNALTTSYVYTVSTYPAVVLTPSLITHATGRTSATGAIAAVTAPTGGTGTGYTYAWTSSSGASTVSTPTELTAKTSLLPGQYTLTAIDSNGGSGSYVFDVTSVFKMTLATQASDPAASDQFGYSCAADGQYMIVGAPFKTVGGFTNAGAAYTFLRSDTTSTGTYAFLAKLVSPAPGTTFLFAISVTMSGDTVGISEANATGGGRAHVFFRSNNTTWTAQTGAGLVSSDRSSGDAFSSPITIDGDYAVIGAYNWSTKSAPIYTACGAAYVFKRTGTTWTQQAQLLAPDPSASDWFGSVLSINGTDVAVGAQNWSTKGTTVSTNCGTVYMYSRTGTSWAQVGSSLLAADGSSNDKFGYTISISGNYMAVTAQNWSQKSPFIANVGAVYMFVRDTSTMLWSQQAVLGPGDAVTSLSFGSRVALRGGTLLVGANGIVASLTGQGYIFGRSGSRWLKVEELLANDGTVNDGFGVAVCLTDKYAICGASTWSRKTPSALASSGDVYSKLLSYYLLPGTVTSTTGNFGDVSTANGSIGPAGVSGGTAPYSYAWSSSSTSVASNTTAGPLTGLAPGQYTLTVTDATAAVTSYVYTVSTYPQLVIVPGAFTHATGIAAASGTIATTTVSGGTGLAYVYAWTNSSGASTISTPTTLFAKVNLLPGQYTLTVTDSNAATTSYVYDVSYTVNIPTTVTANDFAASNYFGYSCSADGLYMVVGAYNKTVAATSGAGVVYTFTRDNTTAVIGSYQYGTRIYSPTPGAGYRFGLAVALSGNTVVVSEPYAPGGGKAHIFLRSSDSIWTSQTGNGLQGSDTVAGDSFAYGTSSVAIDADTAVVSAYNWSTKSAPIYTNCGKLYVFKRTGTAWAQEAGLLAPTPSSIGYLGYLALAISGNYIAAGSYTTTSMYVFVRSGNTWTVGNAGLAVTVPGLISSDNFGSSGVSIDGNNNSMLIGASAKTVNTIGNAGAAYMFVMTPGTGLWSQQAVLTAGDNVQAAYFGSSVQVKGNNVAIGSISATHSGVASAGRTYMFRKVGATWLRAVVYGAADPNANSQFGAVVSMNNSLLHIGAPFWEGSATDMGAVYTVRMIIATLGAIVQPTNYTSGGGSIAAATIVSGGTAPYTYSWSSSGVVATNVTAVTTAALSNITVGTYMLTITGAAGITSTYNYVVTSVYAQIVFGPGVITHATASNSATGNIAATVAPTGGTGVGLVYAWTSSTGASTIATPTTLAAKTSLLPGRYTVTATDNSGGTGSYTYDVSFVKNLTLQTLASDPAASDNFGISCAIDGQYMVVGAYFKTQASVTNAGAAYTYLRSDTTATGTYGFLAKLVSPSPATNAYFGFSVAISVDTVVIGEFGVRSGAGAAHVFFRTNDSTWTLQSGTGLVADDPTASDNFGVYVAIDGDYVVAGAANWGTKIGTVVAQCGAAYVFKRSGTAWAMESGGKLLSGQPTTGASLGTVVAISGNYIAVGAPNDTPTSASAGNCGSVYVFSRTGTVWTLMNAGLPLIANDPTATDRFGAAVSISGDYIAIGASQWSQKAPNAVTKVGAAYVFARNTSTSVWSQQTQVTAGEAVVQMYFGCSVYIRGGNNLVVGSYTATHQGLIAAGRGYLFYRSGPQWTKTAVVGSNTPVASENLGYSVCLTQSYASFGVYRYTRVTPSALSNCGEVLTVALTAQPLSVFATVSNVAIFGQSTGAITGIEASGGTAPYTYAFSNGLSADASAKTGLAAGTYTVTVTDALAATTSATFTVTQNSVLGVTGGAVGNVPIFGQSTGTIAAVSATGGSGVYTYTWSGGGLPPGSTPKTGLTAGTYTLTLTDSVGAVLTRTFNVTQNALVTLTGGTVTPVAIFGQSTGAISAVTVTGGVTPYIYAWTGGLAATAAAKTGLAASTYVLTVTDNVGAVVTKTFIVTQNTAVLVAGGAVTAVAVYGQSTGVISAVLVTGGLAPYTYAWSNGLPANASAKTGLSAGTYVLTVTDSVGATATTSYVILSAVGATAVATVATLSTGGTITVAAVAGTGSYTYSWQRNGVSYAGTGPFLSGLTPAFYACTIVSGPYIYTITTYVGSEIRLVTSPSTITASWTAVPNGLYRVEYFTPPTGTVNVFLANTAATSITIPALKAQTAYTLNVYTTVSDFAGSGLSTVTTTLPVLSLASYSKAAFLEQASAVVPSYDISALKTTADLQASGINKAQIVNTVFATGDTVKFTAALTSTSSVPETAQVVRLQGTLPLQPNIVVYAPFDAVNAALQTVNLKLRDGTTIPVVYNPADGSIKFNNGTVRSIGDKFILDGQLVQLATDSTQ
jgi:hypothetical protein